MEKNEMRDAELLNEDALEEVSGGKAQGKKETNTTNPQGAHWQNTKVAMGSVFYIGNQLWYRIAVGDTLQKIANMFGVGVNTLKARNPLTITNIDRIYAGDCIWIK